MHTQRDTAYAHTHGKEKILDLWGKGNTRRKKRNKSIGILTQITGTKEKARGK
jgi:hypothetical protein